MEAASGPGYKIWAVDDVVYGPVDQATLTEWVSDARVVADTWVFSEKTDSWHKAGALPELRPVFQNITPGAGGQAQASPLIAGVRPGQLRRVKILADMSEQQIGRFAQFMEIMQAQQFRDIVKKGEPGDSMFCILDGEARVRTHVAGKEKILATLRAGEFFGDMALFDHGPRAADVVANTNCTLLKISADSLNRMVSEVPELATPFLVAICRTLTARIRADNKRFT
ncbi:MAG: cyclic nucleotide-binding domain-containing protein, partial [Verrucomicrobia bacterium]|nr:cyclic nucleotide-binding domain-containing protein [Verrucomicrobiota bacterium]